MRDCMPEISKLIREKELALFCGAGISKNSGLPLANELKQYILEKLVTKLPLEEELKRDVFDIFDLDNRKDFILRQKHIKEIMNSAVPFEAFMETISDSSNDISKILDMFKYGEPNTDHTLIAKLANNGCLKTIFTTNFDLLIEKALEKEGLKKDKDFKVYCNEEQFSKIDFKAIEDEISIFKIHGSADDIDSIRTTLKAVASEALSDKRMKVIRHLFSTARHKKVLVLGYSCSDEFDVTPQIQSIEENRKEIIFFEHSKEGKEEIEDIKTKDIKNSFKKFPGKRIKCHTDELIKKLWNSLQAEGIIGARYGFTRSGVEWKNHVDDWAKQLEAKKGEYLRYFISGSIFEAISNFKEAITCYEKALKIAKKEIKDKTKESKCLSNLGTCYIFWGDAKRGTNHLEKALKIAKKMKDRTGEIGCYIGLGNAYKGSGGRNFKKAIKCFSEALKIAEDEEEKAACYVSLCLTFNSLKDFDTARNYCTDALKIFKEKGNKTGEAICHLGLANSYSKHFDKQIECYKKALEIYKDIGDRSGEVDCYKILFDAYKSEGYEEEANEYRYKGLEIYKEMGDKINKRIKVPWRMK